MSSYREKVEKHYHCCKCLARENYKQPLPAASRLVDEIVKKYFCQKAGQGSSCSLFSDRRGSIYSTDKRLNYWNKIIEERKKIACRIQKTTGKRVSHVLYNQLEGHRKIQNVKRMMDYAERLNPTKLSTRREIHIQDSCIFETLPRSERLRKTSNFEIVGTPAISQAEQWTNFCTKENSKSFLMSPFLQRKLSTNKLDIANILGFYPDINRLQVVGQRIHKHPRHRNCISDSELSLDSNSVAKSFEAFESSDYCIQINDTILRIDDKPIESLKFHLEFKCESFERQTQALATIKNLGKKPVQFVWMKAKSEGTVFSRSDFPAFVFNQNAFQISSGEAEDIEVLFMSNERMICEEEWCLKTEPDFFEDANRILVKLTGECFSPDDCLSSMVVDLLDMLMRKTIPGIESNAGQTSNLKEKDLFEKQNPGLRCEPRDLWKFKNIYNQVKTQRNSPSWDMNLQTIKELIDRITDYNQRSTYMESVMNIIREMRRRSHDCDLNIKIILARRLVVPVLDSWEAKSLKILEFIEQTPMEVLIIKIPFNFFIEQCGTIEDKRKTIQHNALYIQMYSSIIQLATDIVSFMENSLLLYTF